MSCIDIHTTLLQADWRACVAAWTERVRGAGSWKHKLSWSVRRFQQPKYPDDVGLVLGPAVLRFDSAGIAMRQGLLHVVHDWREVSEGTATAEHLFLWLEQGSLLVVPIRSLAMPIAEFQACLDGWHDAALSRPAEPVSSALHDGPLPALVRMVTAPSMAD